MTFNKQLLTATLLTIAGLTAVSSANAAEPNPAESALDVSLQVDSVCTINSAGDITLDAIQAGLATTAVTKTAMLTLNCSKGAVPVISLKSSLGTDDGLGEMTSITSGNTDFVPYKLTSGSAEGSAWGSGTNALTLPTQTAGYAVGIETIIYATVTNAADVKPDNYSDTVSISVAY